MAILYDESYVFTDGNGTPLAGGSIEIYDEGTANATSIFSDSALSSALPNPYSLGGDGKPQDNIYLADGTAVDVVVKNSSGATVDTISDTWGRIQNVSSGVPNHDDLTGFVANEHIDHTAVTITAGEGLSYSSGGTDISADATIDLDIDELTAENTLDRTNDQAVFYDASATAHRKTALENFIGNELGDGKWYLGSNQALSSATEATIICNTASHDELKRGTYSTSTGVYTAGSDGARVLVTVHATIAALDAGGLFELMIEAPSTTEVARSKTRNDADSSAGEYTLEATAAVSLSASETVTMRAETSTAETVSSGAANTFISIVELA